MFKICYLKDVCKIGRTMPEKLGWTALNQKVTNIRIKMI